MNSEEQFGCSCQFTSNHHFQKGLQENKTKQFSFASAVCRCSWLENGSVSQYWSGFCSWALFRVEFTSDLGGVISQPLGEEADSPAACPSGWTP